MSDIDRDGWRIDYELAGPDAGHVVVLVAGLGEQIGSVEFPSEHCKVFTKGHTMHDELWQPMADALLRRR